MYGVQDVRADAAGYGIVVYVAEGGAIVWAGRSWTATEPTLRADAPKTFLNHVYALVRTSRPLRIYRYHGVSPQAEARLLGAYWSPARPALRIDNLGYESFHDQGRANLALKQSWNPMSEVSEATLATGSLAFVGRAAAQLDGSRRLAGGAIQFILPSAGHELCLQSNYRG